MMSEFNAVCIVLRSVGGDGVRGRGFKAEEGEGEKERQIQREIETER